MSFKGTGWFESFKGTELFKIVMIVQRDLRVLKVQGGWRGLKAQRF